MQIRLRHSLFAFALLGTAACAESPTALDSTFGTGEDPRARSVGANPRGQAQGLTSFPCTFGIRDDAGAFRARYAEVSFPVSELHPLGARRMYLYRGYSGTEQVLVARCIIPATEQAVRRLDRELRVERASLGGGGITIMGCVTTEEGCTLDPVIVDACVGGGTYPNCGSGDYEDFDACYDFGDCGGSGDWDWGDSGGGGSGGGEESTDPCATGDPVVDDPDVSAGLQSLWAESKPDANLFERVEKAGWIVEHPAGQFSIMPWTGGIERFGCGDYPSQALPAQGRVVGFVHTHPYEIGEAITDCNFTTVQTYNGTPSDVDRRTSIQLGTALGMPGPLPGYIIDKDGYYRYEGESNTATPRRARCGY